MGQTSLRALLWGRRAERGSLGMWGGPRKPPSMLTAPGVKGSTCFLRPDDQKLWESVTGLFFGPNVFVTLVFTGILKCRGGLETGQPGWDCAPLLRPPPQAQADVRGGHAAQQAGQRLGLFPALWGKLLPSTTRRTTEAKQLLFPLFQA